LRAPCVVSSGISVICLDPYASGTTPARAYCQPGSNDSNEILFWLCVDDHNDSAADGPNGDEAVLRVGVIGVEDLQMISLGLEEPLSFCEGNSVLSLVAE